MAPEAEAARMDIVVKRDGASVPRVHAVTNDEILASNDFVRRAKSVMEALGARGAVHIRAHEMPAALFFRIAQELPNRVRKSGRLCRK